MAPRASSSSSSMKYSWSSSHLLCKSSLCQCLLTVHPVVMVIQFENAAKSIWVKCDHETKKDCKEREQCVREPTVVTVTQNPQSCAKGPTHWHTHTHTHTCLCEYFIDIMYSLAPYRSANLYKYLPNPNTYHTLDFYTITHFKLNLEPPKSISLSGDLQNVPIGISVPETTVYLEGHVPTRIQYRNTGTVAVAVASPHNPQPSHFFNKLCKHRGTWCFSLQSTAVQSVVKWNKTESSWPIIIDRTWSWPSAKQN